MTVEEILKQADLKVVDRSAPPAAEEKKPDESTQAQQQQPPEADPTPGQTEGSAQGQQTQEPPQVDRFKVLSESLGREIASDEDLSAWKSSLTENETKLKDLASQVELLRQEKEQLEQAVDPMSYFASKELYTLNGLLKKFPDKNPVALTEISTRDFSKAFIDDPVDVLALELMLENPGIYANRADAKEDVLARYKVEDPEEITPQAKRLMQVDARSAVNKFNTLKSEIKEPEKVDRSAEREAKTKAETERKQKMTEATEPLFTKMIPEALKEVEFPLTVKGDDGKESVEIAFKYDIGEGYSKSKAVREIVESVRNNIIREGTEWTKEREQKVKEELVDLLKANYLYHNRDKIYSTIVQDVQVKIKDEAWMKKHNVRPLNQGGSSRTTPQKPDKLEEQQSAFLKAHGIKV